MRRAVSIWLVPYRGDSLLYRATCRLGLRFVRGIEVHAGPERTLIVRLARQKPPLYREEIEAVERAVVGRVLDVLEEIEGEVFPNGDHDPEWNEAS